MALAMALALAMAMDLAMDMALAMAMDYDNLFLERFQLLHEKFKKNER